MKLETNDLEVELPYRLQQTIYFLEGRKLRHAKIRRLEVSIRSNTGYKNVKIALTAIVSIGGEEKPLQFGCFARTEADAWRSTEARLVSIAESGVKYPFDGIFPKHRQYDDWKP